MGSIYVLIVQFKEPVKVKVGRAEDDDYLAKTVAVHLNDIASARAPSP